MVSFCRPTIAAVLLCVATLSSAEEECERCAAPEDEVTAMRTSLLQTKIEAEAAVASSRRMMLSEEVLKLLAPNECGEGYGDLRNRAGMLARCQACKGPEAYLEVDWGFADGLGYTSCKAPSGAEPSPAPPTGTPPIPSPPAPAPCPECPPSDAITAKCAAAAKAVAEACGAR
eukprot:TRINITY_DN18645_c0_g1_i1.p1 TRINITY_DN18645_c0_g1~~TRINITY_DN18645_c0_g1_i1.p1  ORF type:complete len:173 (+),score=39.05 TRINITY_DN18645_c0_g1_i1:687-1205(+)